MSETRYTLKTFPGGGVAGVSIGYRNAEFVGLRLFPTYNVDELSGRLVCFQKEDFEQVATRRGLGGAIPRIGFGYVNGAYDVELHSLGVEVPREYLRDLEFFSITAPASQLPNLKSALKARIENLLLRNLALGLEAQHAALATDPANYAEGHTNEPAAGQKWTNPSSNPESAIANGIEVIRDSIGIPPNVLILSRKAYQALRRHPMLAGFGSPVTPRLLEEFFGIENVLIGAARQLERSLIPDPEHGEAAEPEPETGRSFYDVWGNSAVLAYAPLITGGIDQPSFGYTYTIEGHPLLEAPFEDRQKKGHVLSACYNRAAYVTCPGAGYLITNPV